jgi:hypothetical protein
VTNSIRRSAWSLVWLLLLIATWLSSCGQFWLKGVSLDELESLCRGARVSDLSGPTNFDEIIGVVFTDPLAASCLIQLLTTVCGCLLVLGISYKRWKNPVSPVLVAGCLYWGNGTIWVVTATPSESLIHLLEALAFCALLYEKTLLLGLCTILLYPMAPAASLYFGAPLFLIYGQKKWSSAYSKVGLLLLLPYMLVATLLLQGTVSPSLSGIGLWALLPIAVLLSSPRIRKERLALYTTLLVVSGLWGTASLAIALCLGDLSHLLYSKCDESIEAEERRPDEIQVSTKTAFHGLAFLTFILAVLPGEQFLNRQILIPAQKKHMSLERLFIPFTLNQHIKNFSQQDWRQRVPFPNLTQHDINVAGELKLNGTKSFSVVSTDRLGESRELSLVYALMSRVPLRGWASTSELSLPLLICKASQQNLLRDGPTLVIRSQTQAVISLESEGAKSYSQLDLSPLAAIPYRTQYLSSDIGTGFEWRDGADEPPWTIYFPDQEAFVRFGLSPARHLISDLSDPENQKEVTVAPLDWEVSGDFSERIHPGGSLVSLTLTLKNTGQSFISSESIDYVELKTLGDLPFTAPKQRIPEEFCIAPGEEVGMVLTLATPPQPSTFELSLTAITQDGQHRVIPFKGPSSLRTYKRLPPVPEWVEPD